jgi:tetratricopeptide (TPR) repeat protein
MDMRQNALPFDWSKVNVLGLPGLIPLFNALRLDRTTPDQLLPLDEDESDDPSCLCNYELQEISNNGSTATAEDFDPCLSLQKTSIEAVRHRKTNKSPQYPWRDIGNVFCGYSTSPLSEIYIFPPGQKSLQKDKAYVVNLWSSLTAEVSELEMKFAKLERQFRDHNPAVIALIKQLSTLYSRLDNYKKAEMMKRRLVEVYSQVLGPRNSKTLEAALSVIEILLAQGQHLKAQAENHALRASILKLVEQDHRIAIQTNYMYARICSGSGRTEEAEKYYRQHLQIMLSLYGPRSMHTIRAISSLSDEIGGRMPKEANILLRTAAQLSVELPPMDESPCRSLRFVVNKLRGRGSYEESYSMATNLLERFSLPLGDQHPAIWKARERLAWSMSAIGRLPESAKLFRTVISHREQRALEFDHSDANSWSGLANVLVDMGEIEEATMWYEKAFETRMAFYGSSNKITVFTAYRLGYCYYKQCKYDEAVDFYGKMVHMLHESDNGRKAVSDFESYILRIQKRINEVNSRRL